MDYLVGFSAFALSGASPRRILSDAFPRRDPPLSGTGHSRGTLIPRLFTVLLHSPSPEAFGDINLHEQSKNAQLSI